MASLGYQTSSWVNYGESFIRNNLNNGKPMLIRGDNNLEGHAWVVDGYDTATYQYVTYAHPYGSSIWWIDSTGDTFTRYLYHFNWGWYGVCNGYFTGSVFNTDNVVFPDTPNNLAGCYFNANVGTITVWK